MELLLYAAAMLFVYLFVKANCCPYEYSMIHLQVTLLNKIQCILHKAWSFTLSIDLGKKTDSFSMILNTALEKIYCVKTF
jgi:hypothetical protein